jgi:hypothetical protein
VVGGGIRTLNHYHHFSVDPMMLKKFGIFEKVTDP